MGVFLRGKHFQVDKDGATTIGVTFPPGTQIDDLAVFMAIGPPGQPDEPWTIDLDAEPASVGGDVSPADSPMLIHQGLWWKIVDQDDLDAGGCVFTAPAANTVAATFIYVFGGVDTSDPVPVSTGLPICESGTNPCAGQNGNRTNPDCPCPTVYVPDVTVPANGMVALFMAFSHKQAWPFAPPEGFEVLDFPLTERTGGGADIAQIVAMKTVYEGPMTGPESIPNDTGWDNAGARMILIRPDVEPGGLDEPDTWYIGDPNEGAQPVTPVVNLNVNGGFGFHVIDSPGPGADLGKDSLQVHTLTEQGWDEAAFGGRTRGPKKAALRCWIDNSTFEGILAANREGKRWLDGQRVLVYVAPGMEPIYFDVFPGSVTPIFAGQERARNLALSHHHTEVLIEFERQGKSRGPRLDSFQADKISNQFNECWVTIDNPAKAESPLRWVFTPPEGRKIVRIWIARLSHGNIDEAVKSERGFGAWDTERVDAIIGDDAAIVASAHGSNSQEVQLEFGTAPFGWEDISRFETTPEDPTSLVGLKRVLLVARQEEGQLVRYRFPWGTAAGFTGLPPYIDPPYVEIDSTQMTETKYRLVDVGEVVVDEFGNALVQQVQVKGDDDTSDGLVVGVDQVKLLPADENLVTVAERSFLSMQGADILNATSALQVQKGVKPSNSAEGVLVEAPLDETGYQRVLGTGAEVGATEKTDEGIMLFGPSTLPLGLHRVIFEGAVYRADGTGATAGQVVLRRSTDGGTTYTTVEEFPLRALPGRQRTIYNRTSSPRAIISWVVTDEDDVWQAYVVFTADRLPDTGTTTFRIYMLNGIHSFVDSVEMPNSIVLDAFAKEAYVMDANGARLRPLEASGFSYANPGPNAFLIVTEEEPVAGMDVGSLNGPAGIVESDWRLNYVLTIVPMYPD